mmetsp:Transcript_41884/g.125185  ORF Transcript_41884/g.125185 Transcript_41884/m.125185 type:complete len:248 (+) Transcript_41884:895-1638(+)
MGRVHRILHQAHPRCSAAGHGRQRRCAVRPQLGELDGTRVPALALGGHLHRPPLHRVGADRRECREDGQPDLQGRRQGIPRGRVRAPHVHARPGKGHGLHPPGPRRRGGRPLVVPPGPRRRVRLRATPRRLHDDLCDEQPRLPGRPGGPEAARLRHERAARPQRHRAARRPQARGRLHRRLARRDARHDLRHRDPERDRRHLGGCLQQLLQRHRSEHAVARHPLGRLRQSRGRRLCRLHPLRARPQH